MRPNILYLLSITLPIAFASCNNQNDFDATGTFEATEITIGAEANGKILDFHIEEGSTVNAGDSLGRIDCEQMLLQREMLQKQQAALIAGKPNVEKQVAALRGQIATAETELKRLKRMQAGGAATGKQVDDVEAQLSVLRSQLDATLQSLNASVSSLNNNVSAMELQIRQLDYSISKATISSPISGTVMVKYLNAGEMAAAGRPLMKVADLDHMYLRAYFTSEQLSDISLGDEVTVIADFGGDKQIEYPGTIVWIAQESEFTPKGIQTRGDRANLVYAVKIAVKNDGRLKVGLFGEVKLNSKKNDRH